MENLSDILTGKPEKKYLQQNKHRQKNRFNGGFKMENKIFSNDNGFIMENEFYI